MIGTIGLIVVALAVVALILYAGLRHRRSGLNTSLEQEHQNQRALRARNNEIGKRRGGNGYIVG